MITDPSLPATGSGRGAGGSASRHPEHLGRVAGINAGRTDTGGGTSVTSCETRQLKREEPSVDYHRAASTTLANRARDEAGDETRRAGARGNRQREEKSRGSCPKPSRLRAQNLAPTRCARGEHEGEGDRGLRTGVDPWATPSPLLCLSLFVSRCEKRRAGSARGEAREGKTGNEGREAAT